MKYEYSICFIEQIFDVILSKKPLFYLQMGDLFYGDVEVNDETVYK